MKSGLTLMRRPRRASREPVVAMINIVFLLLIFFLMTAQIVPPAPFDLSLPNAKGQDDAARDALYISQDGVLAFGDARGDAALTAAMAATQSGRLRVQADANLDAATLASTLAALAAIGMSKIDLVTEGR